MSGVKAVRNYLKLVRENAESLTPLHPILLHLCLSSKCYNAALETLSEEVFELNAERSGVTYRDLLLYYYYGGLIYTGVKNYKAAFKFFSMVHFQL